MSTKRIFKTLSRGLAAGIAALAFAVPMQSWSQSEVASIVVPFPPGGPADVIGRILASSGMGDTYGKKLLIDNKPGAAGLIGTRYVAKAPADGGTFLLTPNFFVQNAILYDKPGYDPLKDFVAVGAVGTTYLVFAINAKHPAKTLKEFVALSKAEGDKVSFGSAGSGSAPHLAGFALNKVAGLNMTHVPYKGEAPALQDLVGGQVTAGFFAPISIMPFVADGRVRILGIATPQRMSEFPGVPTMAEAGFDHAVFRTVGWFGLFAPAGTSETNLKKMGEALSVALKKPEVSKKLSDFGIRAWDKSPSEFSAVLRSDYDTWKTIIDEANVKLTLQ